MCDKAYTKAMGLFHARLRLRRISAWVAGAAALAFGFAIGPTRAATEDVAPGTGALDLAGLFAPWGGAGQPGLAVGVMHRGRTIHRAEFGAADLASERPIVAETRFQAGSIAKQLTAVAVLMLEEEGRLSLEDDIRDYLPELPDYRRPIAIRHLLNQTSGLRDYRSLMLIAGWLPGDVQTHAQALRLIFRQKALNFPPGEGFAYSNSNFVLAAEIVARVAGVPFPEWMRENVFRPLGMDDTLIRDDPGRIVPRLAASYAYGGRGAPYLEDILLSNVWGSGNLIATVGDMLTWGNYAMTARLGDTPLLDRLKEEAVLPGGQRTGYGLGVFVGRHGGRETFHHAGETAGNRAHLLLVPEQRLVIAVLANVSAVNAEAATGKIADTLLAALVEGSASPDEAPAPDWRPALPLETYVGLYQFEEGHLLEVRLVGDVLIAIFGMTPPDRLISRGGNSFGAGEPGVRFDFFAGDAGTVERVALVLPGRQLFGRRLPAVSLSERELARYAGRYASDEIETFYDIEAEGETLRVRHARFKSFTLRPIGGNRFLDVEGGNLLMTFRQSRIGRVTGFDLTMSRVFSLRFDKE